MPDVDVALENKQWLFGAVLTLDYQNFPKWHQCQPVLQCPDDRQTQPSATPPVIARAADAGELPGRDGRARRQDVRHRRVSVSAPAERPRCAGTIAGTVTGSTGAEVSALGTVIGVVGATEPPKDKPK
jgi:hypothetical protein